jgi:hypothetical protein
VLQHPVRPLTYISVIHLTLPVNGIVRKMPAMQTERFEMRFSVDLLKAVDDWRNQQTVPPPRAAAIRFLIEAGLNAQRADSDQPGGRPAKRKGKKR